MALQTSWDLLPLRQRITAANADIMNHIDFSILGGSVMMGKIEIVEGMRTAATDGLDVFYDPEFLARQSRKQVRFVQLHENMHKSLGHCTDYPEIMERCKTDAPYKRKVNQAMDYVVNAFIEQTDPDHHFIEHTTDPAPLLDKKYYNRSFIDVLQDLLKEDEQKQQQQQQQQQSGGQGQGQADEGDGTLDDHMPNQGSAEEKEQLSKDMREALNHGEQVSKRLKEAAGKKGGGNALSGMGVVRKTDWRNALRNWIEEICAGDEYSQFNPPNRRMLPLGIIIPSHFDVAAGELAILCDTSGSMEPIYPIVFGEISNIAQQANPERVRLIWWDTRVRGEQVFERGKYADIAKQLKPRGGGGTTPQCVANYLEEKKYPLTGAIWLTDGWLDSCPTRVNSNELWGVVNNDRFQPKHGKIVRIHA